MSHAASVILEELVDELSSRLCTVCEEPIPAKRIKAVPGVSMCVGCLRAAGDVPKLMRHDESFGQLEDLEVVSIYYKRPNAYLKSVIESSKKRATHRVPTNTQTFSRHQPYTGGSNDYGDWKLQRIPVAAEWPTPPTEEQHPN